jgi:HAD superfamily hydrolase (TIGR01549 family)
MTKARAWLVDFDGTLYHAKPVQALMALELALFGWRTIKTLRRFRKSHEQLRRGELDAHPAVDVSLSPFEQQLAVTAADLGLSLETVRTTVEQWMMVRPRRWIRLFRRQALLDELVQFQARGGKLALVSDYPLQVKVQALAGLVTFDTIVASGETGGPTQLKPAPHGYLAAAGRLDVPPEACLVIGDRVDADGKAAEAAGMKFRLVR